MRRLLLTVASLMMASPAAAIDDRQSCLNQRAGDATIEACSRVIGTTPQDATAYYNRGASYRQAGDFDRAISDFNKAVELKPSYGAAYNARGLVHAAKGDYERALADVTRATELAKGLPKVPLAQKAASTPKKEFQLPKRNVVARAQWPREANAEQMPNWAPFNSQ